MADIPAKPEAKVSSKKQVVQLDAEKVKRDIDAGKLLAVEVRRDPK